MCSNYGNVYVTLCELHSTYIAKVNFSIMICNCSYVLIKYHFKSTLRHGIIMYQHMISVPHAQHSTLWQGNYYNYVLPLYLVLRIVYRYSYHSADKVITDSADQ